MTTGQEVDWSCNSNDWIVDDPLASCGLGDPDVSWGRDNIDVVSNY